MEKLSRAQDQVTSLLIPARLTHFLTALFAPLAVGKEKIGLVFWIVGPVIRIFSLRISRIFWGIWCRVSSTGLPVFFWMMDLVRVLSFIWLQWRFTTSHQQRPV